MQRLRQTSASLDKTLKTTFELLIQTRREIKAIPIYSEQQNGKPLPVRNLLDYSKFIARTSTPPTRREQPQVKAPVEEEIKPAITNGDLNTPLANGLDTPAVKDSENLGVKMLDDQTKRMLDPFKDAQFEPWPRYEMLQQGALADIQRMLDAGKDPASVLSAEEQAEADRLKAAEEERERLEEEERERRRHSLYQGGTRSKAQDDVFDPDEA